MSLSFYRTTRPFRRPFRPAVLALVLLAAAGGTTAPRSGPQPGDRPLPFTSNMVTGPHRGKQYCYVCEMKDETAVLVFARRLDEATGRLLTELRDNVRTHRKEKLFGWMVLLAPDGTQDEAALESQAHAFARANAATEVPISVLGDPQGPPGYLIAPDAALTLVVFRQGKVLYNRAYTAREWDPRAAASALKKLPEWLPAAPKG